MSKRNKRSAKHRLEITIADIDLVGDAKRKMLAVDVHVGNLVAAVLPMRVDERIVVLLEAVEASTSEAWEAMQRVGAVFK